MITHYHWQVSEGQYMWSLVTSQSFLKNWNQVDILIKPKVINTCI